MAIPEKPAYPFEDGLPDTIWLGVQRGEWPIHAFTTAEQAQRWQAENVRQVRRIWELSPTAIATERIVVVPDPKLEWRDLS